MRQCRTILAAALLAFGTLPNIARAQIEAEAPASGAAPSSRPVLFTSAGTDISQAIARAIGSAKVSLEIALYKLDLPNLAQAILEAKQRGVQVRIVMDYSGVLPVDGAARPPALESLVRGGIDIRVVKGFGTYGFMHNKFMIIDGAWLETGSYNWSAGSNFKDYNNVIFRNDPLMVQGFAYYWQWMWKQAATIPEAAHGMGDPLDYAPTELSKPVSFKGQPFPLYVFAPKGGIASTIVRLIDLSQSRIDIAAMGLTSPSIENALLAAQKRGVSIRILLSHGAYQIPQGLVDAGIEVRLVAGIAPDGFMHNKFGIFDGELVETGSFNYTPNAAVNNFENSVYLTDAVDIAAFAGEFEKLYALGQPPTPQDSLMRPSFSRFLSSTRR